MFAYLPQEENKMVRSKKEEMETKSGKLSLDDLKKLVNSVAKTPVAHNLSQEDLSVKEWISTR